MTYTGIVVGNRTATRDLTAEVVWQFGPKEDQWVKASWSNEEGGLVLQYAATHAVSTVVFVRRSAGKKARLRKDVKRNARTAKKNA